ncbi:MAG: hypothetical protein DMD35_14640, partial [Gemmatimonadetes bacterium]
MCGFGVQHLHRDAAVMARIERQVHRGHPSAPELTLDRVPVSERAEELWVHAEADWRPGTRGEHRAVELEGQGGAPQFAAPARRMQPIAGEPSHSPAIDIVSSDRAAPQRHQEVLKRSDDEAGKARQAGKEMRKPGLVASI